MTAEAAELFVKVDGDNRGAISAMNGVNDSVGKSGGFFKSAASNALGFGTAMLSMQATGMVFDGIKNAVFGTNAELERSQLQFETLMGSSDKAAAHVKDLFEFAKKTPFETGPVIEASRVMETFGGAALDTNDNLTLFGDAAAATSQPINDIAFWMSRAYAAIQAGQPFGEARMRLMEMGVITPQVASSLDDLTKSGASNDQVWGALTGSLGKFGGAMEKQAGTWDGITSTLADTVNLTLAGAFHNLFDAAKGAINGMIGFFSDPAVQKTIGDIATTVGNVISAFFNLAGMIGGVFTTFSGAVSGGNSALAPFSAAVGNFANVVGPAFSKIGTFISGTVLPALSQAFGWIATNIAPILIDIFNTLSTTVLPILGDALSFIADLVIAAWPTIAEIAGHVGNAIKIAFGVIKGAIDFIAPLITWLAKNVFPLLGAAAGFIGKAIGQAFSFISKAVQQASAVINTIVGAINKAWQLMGAGLDAVWKGIQGVFKAGLNFIIGIGNAIIRAINGIQVHIGRIGMDTPIGFIGFGPFDWNGLNIPYLRPFEKGTWDTGPRMTPALLHPHEAVFPRAAADALREMAATRSDRAGSSGISVVHVHVGTFYGYDKSAVDQLGDRIGERVQAGRVRRRATA